MEIKIGDRAIGDGHPVFIVAEISCNHLQKKEFALKLIEEAKKAGADAIKFQTYTPDTLTMNVDNEYFRLKKTIWKGRTLYDLYEEAYTPWDWFDDLKEKADKEGLIFFSSPFDESAVNLLEKLKVPCYKVASFEINHIPLLKYIASKNKPVIISMGVAASEDIELALKTLRQNGAKDIILLKCTSSYPALLKEANLKTIQDMSKKFGVIAGLSDHTSGIVAPVVSVAFGAKVIEKHFILDRRGGGPDAPFSLEPEEFKEMVKRVREAEDAIGKVDYNVTASAKEHKFLMRSIFVTENMKRGDVFTKQNIRIIRPGHGLHPKHYENVLGLHACKDILKGTPLEWNLIAEGQK